jgi:hypothetical protein
MPSFEKGPGRGALAELMQHRGEIPQGDGMRFLVELSKTPQPDASARKTTRLSPFPGASGYERDVENTVSKCALAN